MEKYIVFIKGDESKVILKSLVTAAVSHELRSQGFRKHHIEVDAKNEKDAIKKLNKSSHEYLDELKEFSGSAFICSVIAIVMLLIYFFRI